MLYDLCNFRDDHVNIMSGCNRTDQCNPDPCNARGECTDLWTRFTCQCHRPYLGDTCSQSKYTQISINISN